MVENVPRKPESYGGTSMPIKNVAAISTPTRMIVIQPWDKSLIKEIEKPSPTPSLVLIPAARAEVIRISIPDLTAERRQEMTKAANKMAEEGRVVIRNLRHDALDDIPQATKGFVHHRRRFEIMKWRHGSVETTVANKRGASWMSPSTVPPFTPLPYCFSGKAT